ncbi:hypothetical protein [Roseomonas sp. KE2513]|uniref:hypothetical protein n=1 Tax=Roseomonas sp. KE2513 TaxID=2479202 RepID=UPI0018E03C1D|nr:hypothetical protein [Roseomonas sp. KE2513]
MLEDEYIIAAEIKHWLEQEGAAVIGPFPNAAAALQALADPAAAPDAGVLDINLGRGGTAYPVAERLDALGVRYIFATGNNQDVGGDAFSAKPRLEKPVSTRALLRAVEDLLSDRA